MPQHDPSNSGDDVAGTIVAVGSDVTSFHPGDRVAAMHEMMAPWGTFAEYAVAYEHATFHLPASVAFEEAATIPLAGMTAVMALFRVLGVPEPWVLGGGGHERDDPVDGRWEALAGGVVVYGAASAVGAFAVKLLAKCGVHPIICVAGNGAPFIETLIDRAKGDTIVDYRDGNEAVVRGIKNAVPDGATLRYAFDAISEHGSYVNLGRVLDTKKGSKLALVMPGKKYEGIPRGVKYASTSVGDVHWDEAGKEIALAWFRLFTLGLKEGWLTGHPFEVVDNGLEGVGGALQRLKDGKVSAKKLVFRVSDTPGLALRE